LAYAQKPDALSTQRAGRRKDDGYPHNDRVIAG
jgi:hypothetical protein